MRRLLSWINIHYDGSPSVLAGLNAINLRVAMLSAKSIKYIRIRIQRHRSRAYTDEGILLWTIFTLWFSYCRLLYLRTVHN